MNLILASSATTSLYPLDGKHSKIITMQQASYNTPIIVITDTVKNQDIRFVYHCYLIIENNLLDTKIIVDPTVSNYRTDQNIFIGSTIDLLQSLLELITDKKEYYKGKLPFHQGNIQKIHDINNFIYNGIGNKRSVAVAMKHAWYGSI